MNYRGTDHKNQTLRYVRVLEIAIISLHMRSLRRTAQIVKKQLNHTNRKQHSTKIDLKPYFHTISAFESRKQKVWKIRKISFGFVFGFT